MDGVIKMWFILTVIYGMATKRDEALIQTATRWTLITHYIKQLPRPCPGKPKDNVKSMGCCLGLVVGSVGWGVGANGLRASFWSPHVTGMSYNRLGGGVAVGGWLHPTPLTCAPQISESWLNKPVFKKLLRITGNKEMESIFWETRGLDLVQESSWHDRDFHLRTGIT